MSWESEGRANSRLNNSEFCACALMTGTAGYLDKLPLRDCLGEIRLDFSRRRTGINAMSISAPQPSPRGQPATGQQQSRGGSSGRDGGGGGGGDRALGDGPSWWREFAKGLIGPSVLAAVVLAIGGWFITDKFDTIRGQIDDLGKRVDSNATATRDVNNLLNSSSINLVQQIGNTNVTVSAMKPQLDQLSGDVKGMTATLNSIDQRTIRTEAIIQQAPWKAR